MRKGNNSRGRVMACRVCGTDFTSRRGQRLCSTDCRRSRHAIRTASVFTRSQRMAIFERDAWMCGICLDPVDPSLTHPDLMSATVDHVIPVARGGEHSRENAQCAHYLCNMRKSTRISPHG